jgi:hypothetical protein
MSPKYLNLSGIADINPKPPILWVRGDRDAIVSDSCMRDIGYLGKMGYLKGWPGEANYPPQPMVTQTRYVLEKGWNIIETYCDDGYSGTNFDRPGFRKMQSYKSQFSRL